MATAKRSKALDQNKAEAKGLVDPAGNQAEAYGVRIVPAQAAAGQDVWRVVGVRHLSPVENQGKHVIFVDAQDAAGQRRRDPNLRIGWTWEGRNPDRDRADPKALDKPDSEPAGNVDMFSGQHIELWLQGDGIASDHVLNLHTNHADEPGPKGELWNTLGHHSFHVVFRRERAGTATGGTPPAGGGTPPAGGGTPPTGGGTPPTGGSTIPTGGTTPAPDGDVAASLQRIEAKLDRIIKHLGLEG
jgi:hypothetical protein